MDHPEQVIASLASSNSRLHKEKVVYDQALADNDVFFAGARLALDPMVTFGIRQVAEINESGPGLTWADFVQVADQLADRSLTGHAARDAVLDLQKKATVAQWNDWYRRILLKNLACGVTEKTINKSVRKAKRKKYLIEVFSCQLADDAANNEKYVTGKKLIDTKLDGMRVLTIVYPRGTVLQYSRNGKVLENFSVITDQFATTAGFLDEPYVFDGEVMSASFQDLMKQARRKYNVQADDSVLHLFDAVPLSEFTAGASTKTLQERHAFLQKFYDQHHEQLLNVEVVANELVDLDTAAGKDRYDQLVRLAAIGGYEGIMIKDPASLYRNKRTSDWLKVKPFIEVSLTIVGFEEGTGRNQGRLGALVVEGWEPDIGFIQTNVGSGFSDKQRDEFWQAREELLGQIVEIRADTATQAQNSEVLSLRFPRFKVFRGFDPGEKL